MCPAYGAARDKELDDPWPLPITALREWIEQEGDVEKMSEELRGHMTKFLNGYCYGFSANAQSTERHAKDTREQTRNKRKQDEVVTRQMQQQKSIAGEEKYEIAKDLHQKALDAQASNATAAAGEDNEQTKHKRIRLRGTKPEKVQRLIRLQQRERDIAEKKKTAVPVEKAPEDARLEQEALDVAERHAHVTAQDKGFRNCTSFSEFMPKLSVVDDRIVPKMPAGVLGKIKLCSLNSYEKLVPVLRARGFTELTTYKEDPERGKQIPELQKLFLPQHLETVLELTGRNNDVKEVVYVRPLDNSVAGVAVAAGAVVDDFVYEEISEDLTDEELLTACGESSEGASSASSASSAMRLSSRVRTPNVIVSV